jgi:NAD(P)H-hydrate repair Nnr-like enzyme with NAD(P)H-hydrate epimerase domain
VCSSSYNNNDHGDGNELVSVEVVSVAAAWTVVMAGGGDNGGDGDNCW